MLGEEGEVVQEVVFVQDDLFALANGVFAVEAEAELAEGGFD